MSGHSGTSAAPGGGAREAILARVSERLGRAGQAVPAAGTAPVDLPAAVRERLASEYRHTQPCMAGATLEVLVERMEQALISVTPLQSDADLPEALRWYLDQQGIEGEITVAPALAGMDWSALTQPEPASNLVRRVRVGAASGTESVGVSGCVAAVAETGSIVTVSGPEAPAALNFLPDTHVVVLGVSQVVRSLDDLWAVARQLGAAPRALNLLTGPSRTADIEQTLEIGAHGPRRMHVLLVAGR